MKFSAWHFALSGVFLITLIFAIYHIPYTVQLLEEYGSWHAQETLGSQSLAPIHEAKIHAIAQEMGITEPIAIRKMNYTALAAFGYHNAFAYCPSMLCGCIPLSNKPFLFISEGFFEDLSPQEQRFLIGHELIHAKEKHMRYAYLISYVLGLGIIGIGWYLLRRRWKLHAALCVLIIGVGLGMIDFVELGYQRHIERVADIESMKILNSYDGCLAIMDRWMKEFSHPLHNSYGGWFADHPSLHERKTCCLELQNNYKGSL
jgi:Zn-dependent protease with chaperone function